MKRCILTWTGILAGVCAAAAQNSAPTFRGALEVQEVLLEVQVTDAEGAFVEGLGREDFRVLLGGAAVAVTAARRVGGGTRESLPAGDAGENGATVAAPEPVRVVLFIDSVHVSPASRLPVLSQVYGVLRERLRPGDQVMVATWERALRILQPFTDDWEALAEALRAADGLSAGRLAGGSGERRTLEQIQQVFLALRELPDDPCPQIEGLARTLAAEQRNEVDSVIRALSGFVDSLAGLSGRKAILHVSDGLPLVAGRAAYDYVTELCDGVGAARGVPGAMLRDNPGDLSRSGALRFDVAQFDLSERWTRLAARANRQNVSFYMVRAGGAGGGPSATTQLRLGSLETEAASRWNEQDTLLLLAEETGGRAVTAGSAFAPFVEGMLDELRAYYEVSFRADGVAPGSVLSVRVSVDRPGARTRHRRSLLFKSRHEQVGDRVLGAALRGDGENPAGLRLELLAHELQGRGRAKARVRVAIPLAALTALPGEGGGQAVFTLFLVVADENGRTTPVRQRTLGVELPAAGAPDGLPRDYLFETELLLRRGPQRLGVALLDELSGTTSFLQARLVL
jgi:VWFA-related protein